MFSTKLFLALPALASLCLANPVSQRAIGGTASFTGYGTNISAAPLVYGNADGLLYLSDHNSSDYSSLLITVGSSTTAWNGTTLNGTSLGPLYLVNSGSEFQSVGFVASNGTLPTNATTIGFMLYGGQVSFTDGTTLESQFWATSTDDADVWSVKWNSDGSDQDDSTPVTLKASFSS